MKTLVLESLFNNVTALQAAISRSDCFWRHAYF